MRTAAVLAAVAAATGATNPGTSLSRPPARLYPSLWPLQSSLDFIVTQLSLQPTTREEMCGGGNGECGPEGVG